MKEWGRTSRIERIVALNKAAWEILAAVKCVETEMALALLEMQAEIADEIYCEEIEENEEFERHMEMYDELNKKRSQTEK